jgi:hypothetical protein
MAYSNADITKYVPPSHVRWVPCHHSMACPQVADGEDGLQIWRVAANISNKQSRTADMGWSFSLYFGCGVTYTEGV